MPKPGTRDAGLARSRMKTPVADLLATVASSGGGGTAIARERRAPNAVARANDPRADFAALNTRSHCIGELSDPEADDANRFRVRFAKPFSVGESLRIMRLSLPITTRPVPPAPDHDTGIGALTGAGGVTAPVGGEIVAACRRRTAGVDGLWSS